MKAIRALAYLAAHGPLTSAEMADIVADCTRDEASLILRRLWKRGYATRVKALDEYRRPYRYTFQAPKATVRPDWLDEIRT